MAAPDAPSAALTLAVSPSGRPRIAVAEGDEEALTGERASAVRDAFERSPGAGVLYLGAVEVGTSLPPAFAFFRELGHELVARLCARTDLEALRGRARVEPPRDWIAEAVAATPPMRGAEYVAVEALETLWTEANEAFASEVSAWRGPVIDWLHARSAAWAAVGRIVFHLAENKRDPERPAARAHKQGSAHRPTRAAPVRDGGALQCKPR
jgi:hypothetical protein